MYHILVVGAGYTGSRTAFFFKEQKQKVWALTRSAARGREFEQAGIVPVYADLTKPETLDQIPPAHFIVLCPAPDDSTEEGYRKIYLEGIQNFLMSRKKMPRPNLILYFSSTAVWRERQGGWVDESVPPDPDSAKGKILVEAENQVLESGFPSVIFRLAGIYGPGRNRVSALRAGEAPPQTADGYMNLIHVEDIVRAVPVLFKKAESGQVYTGVDEEPVLRSEFYEWVMKNVIRRPHSLRSEQAPAEGSASIKQILRFSQDDKVLRGKRCRNQKLKALGFELKYPTFREGYAGLCRS